MLKFISKLSASFLLVVMCSFANSAIIVSGDGNIGNPLNGSSGSPVTMGNSQFFSNILGTGSNVMIESGFFMQSIGNSINAINDFYSGLGGVTSNIFEMMITDELLADVDLLISTFPTTEYLDSEENAIQSFLGNGGTLFLLGDNVNSPSANNNLVNDLLVELGSDLRIGNNSIDPGFNTTANVSAHPFTNGISSFTYAATNSVAGGFALVSTEDGDVFIATDVQPTQVNAPSTLILISMVLLGFGAYRKRLA